MNIEVGKSYVTRGGWLATAIYRLSSGEFVFVHFRPGSDTEDIDTHRADGVFLGNGCKSAWDVVKEANGLDWALPQVAVIGGAA